MNVFLKTIIVLLTPISALAQITPVLSLSGGTGTYDIDFGQQSFEEDTNFFAGGIGIMMEKFSLSAHHVEMTDKGDTDTENTITSLMLTYDLGARENAYTGFSLGVGRQDFTGLDFNAFTLAITHTKVFGRRGLLSLGGDYSILQYDEDRFRDDDPEANSWRGYLEGGFMFGQSSLRLGYTRYTLKFKDDILNYKTAYAYLRFTTRL